MSGIGPHFGESETNMKEETFFREASRELFKLAQIKVNNSKSLVQRLAALMDGSISEVHQKLFNCTRESWPVLLDISTMHFKECLKLFGLQCRK